MSPKERNDKIADSLRATRAKRKKQTCRVYTVKIDESELEKLQAESVKMLFVEAKWLTNEAIASGNVFTYKPGKTVKHFDKDKNEVVSEYKHLSSQMRQSAVSQLQSNVKALNTKKERGQKTGQLKFKKEVSSIELKQYGNTYKVVDKHHVKIQCIPGKIRVNGLDQIYSNSGQIKYELANAKFLKKPDGYYLSITCFSYKEKCKKQGEIGIDLGVSTAVTLSDGRKFDAFVEESDRLKRLQRKLERQKKGSNRRWKTIQLIGKEHQKMTNKKTDISNKIVAEIFKFKDIYMQDDNVSGWKIRYGKKIQHSVVGRVKAKVKTRATWVLGRFVATTKTCTECGTVHNDLTLNDRQFVCQCGVDMDRDVHAAQNMIVMSKHQIAQFELS